MTSKESRNGFAFSLPLSSSPPVDVSYALVPPIARRVVFASDHFLLFGLEGKRGELFRMLHEIFLDLPRYDPRGVASPFYPLFW